MATPARQLSVDSGRRRYFVLNSNKAASQRDAKTLKGFNYKRQ